MQLQYKYEFTKEDYLNYFMYVQNDSPESKAKWRKYYIKIFLYSFFFLGFFVFINKGIDFRSNVNLVIYLGVYIFFYFVQILNAKRNNKKYAGVIINDARNANMFREVEIVLSERGVALQDDLNQTFYTWQAIIKRTENEQYYFLFVNTIQAIILPKRILKNEEDKKQLEQELAKYISMEADIRMKQ